MKKVLAMLVAFALIITLIPMNKAQAAELPKLNSTARTIYVDGSSVVKSGNYAHYYYTLKVKNKTAKYSCSWSTDNDEVVQVEKLKGGKAKVTALKPGTATVTANFVDKTSNTRYTLNSTITVKKNCVAVGVTGYNGSAIKVGAQVQLDATMYDEGGREVTSGKEVTDIIRWTSSNERIATVSDKGVVTATGAGTADITCYTIQSETGTYSKFSKATAQKSVTFTIEDPDIIGIVQAKVVSLNSVEIKLGSTELASVTKDNFSITAAGGVPIDIKELKMESDNNTLTLVTTGEFSDGASYTVVIKDTKATVKLMNTFTFTYGIPSKLEVVTPLSGNRVIAGKLTELKFRIYNADGVDITPTDENSTEYLNEKNRVTFESPNSGYWFVSDNYIFIYDENKSVEVKATYTRAMEIGGKYVPISFAGKTTVISVNEATTVTFNASEDLALANPETAGSKIKFEGKSIGLPINDENDRYLIARVKDYTGNYIYSNDVNSPVIFEPQTTEH
ncbi:MAG: Ig-like domain-containing protein, partial [Lachnospiraceae bacterium]|nr:Ig-like domain-containing protein [Lachnospiraceae bacterium]